MREFIIFHLDGNRIMWQNFIDVSMTRGILKLDVLANLEYFSCFSMILFRDEIAPEYDIWLTIGALFIFTSLVQAFGGYGTVSARKHDFSDFQFLTFLFLIVVR